ncbi:hypothetical protein [Faucicola boevrei]|uniref:hypothetical protein n=1 Tax=Faucicola boevrei TaxID=346665 RepID=UPI00037208D4|nr:hypothetical protein [Moraxella boevrei]
MTEQNLTTSLKNIPQNSSQNQHQNLTKIRQKTEKKSTLSQQNTSMACGCVGIIGIYF